jgi:hypothetical protein
MPGKLQEGGVELLVGQEERFVVARRFEQRLPVIGETNEPYCG